ncbi:MAG: hypothetical protein PHT94_00835 [Candidatus Nanoarchaeia archaeon]|nr:hypothetical protein [Candidatus Nanoarchaeia archaeon]
MENLKKLTRRSYLAAENFKRSLIDFKNSVNEMIIKVNSSHSYVQEKSKIIKQNYQNFYKG